MRHAVLAFDPVLNVIFMILQFVIWTVAVWVVISWIRFFAEHSSFRWRYRGFFTFVVQLDNIFSRMTYLLLRPFRRWLRRYDTAGIDWSPLLLLFCIWMLRALILFVRNLILFP